MIMITVGVTANGDPAAPPATEGAGGPGAGRRARSGPRRPGPSRRVKFHAGRYSSCHCSRPLQVRDGVGVGTARRLAGVTFARKTVELDSVTRDLNFK